MKRTYTAQILRIEDGNGLDKGSIYLNIDLGFQTWKVVQALYLNQRFRRPPEYAAGDWIVVNFYQRKYAGENFESRYEYDAIVVSETKEPRVLFTE